VVGDYLLNVPDVGPKVAVMVQDARLYYVRCNRYVHTRQEKLSHGKAIVTTPQVHFLENFNIMLPDERGMKLLVKLHQTGDMRTSDILEYLHGERVEGFEDDPTKLSRGDKIGMLMRLNKGITGKIQDAGYIAKEKRGREDILQHNRVGEIRGMRKRLNKNRRRLAEKESSIESLSLPATIENDLYVEVNTVGGLTVFSVKYGFKGFDNA